MLFLLTTALASRPATLSIDVAGPTNGFVLQLTAEGTSSGPLPVAEPHWAGEGFLDGYGDVRRFSRGRTVTVVVRAPGYAPNEQVVRLRKRRRTSLEVVLQPVAHEEHDAHEGPLRLQ
jgi:hypothetical protein